MIVSTATLALQRQIMARDLPLVAKALEPHLPRPASIAQLKGWHNYVCIHKVAGGYPEDDPQAALFELGDHAGAVEHPAAEAENLGSQVVRLREWAEETTTGDRDDLVPGVTDRAWKQVSVASLECLGSKCPMLTECFPERAKAASRVADVVVTNHAMLGIAASGSPNVLPEHQVLVVDEAHELTDRVTAQATSELSVGVIEHASRLARRNGGIPTTDLDSASQALAAVLVTLPEARFRDGLPPAARDAVAGVRDATRALLTALKPEGGGQSQQDAGRKVAQATMLALYEVADRMAADPEDNRHTVLWCARSEDRRGNVSTRLYAAPLAVNGLIRTHMLAGRSGVLTSATLELGGSIDPIARAVGLEVRPDAAAVGPASIDQDAPAPPSSVPWHGLDVGSPFDYPKQGILYLARHLPPPGREPATEAQLDEIAELVAPPPAGARSACSRPGAPRTPPRRPCANASTCRSSCRATTSCPRSCSSSSPTRPPACSGPSRSGRASTCPGARARS